MKMPEKKLDCINIRIPCSPEYSQLARLALSSVASRMNFSIDEIEKLKEALSVVCGYFALKPQNKTMNLSLEIYRKKLVIGIDHGQNGSKIQRKSLEKLITTLMINRYIDSFKLNKKIYLEKIVK